MRTRLAPKERKQQIVAAALKLAEKHGYLNVTRDAIAAAAGVSQGLVTARVGPMVTVRTAIMRAAIANENLRVLAQGLVERDKIALRAPKELIRRAALHLAP